MYGRPIAVTGSAVLAVAWLLIVGPAAAAQQDLDCADLTYEEAQAELSRDPSDPHDLDRDNDGEACDESPRAGAAAGQTNTVAGSETDAGRTPAGGVETGAGGTAAQDSGLSSGGWFAVAGAAALTTAAAAGRRRRSR
jgi:hypothetical protein